MTLVFLTYAGAEPGRISARLEAEGVRGHTRIDHAHGHGLTGPREGTRAWPGEVTVFVAVVPTATVEGVMDALRREAGGLPEGERLHLAALPVEHFF